MDNTTTRGRGFTGAGIISGLAIAGIVGAMGAAVVGVSSDDAVYFASGNAPEKVKGPDACAECHPKEAEAWKTTHHHATFIDLPRNDKAREIADKMGIRAIKSDSTCLTCHFTVQGSGSDLEPISGISCESCHGAGADWIDIHSSYAEGVTRETETEAQRLARIEAAVDKGMLSPMDLYAVAENCYQCHTAPNEELVNKGGHPAGSNFDLVAWSQGEVRHNFNRTDGASNAEASPESLRVMWILGKMLDLEYGIRGLANATADSNYSEAMKQRISRAYKQLNQINGIAPIGQIDTILASVTSGDLKPNNEAALLASAEKVKAAAQDFASTNDGSGLGALDKYVDQIKAKAKGTAYDG